jgi:glycosyltransferase involved in cell wall biosynthesis
MPEPSTSRDSGERPAGRETVRIRPRERSGESEAVQGTHRIVVFSGRLELDGLTLYARTLIRALRDSGNKVMLVAPQGPLSETFADSFDRYFSITRTSRLGFFEWRRLRAALLEFSANVMHATSPGVQVAVRSADELGTPLAVSVHGVKPGETPGPRDDRFDAYIAADQGVRQALNAEGLERDRTTLVANAVYPEARPEPAEILDARRRPVVTLIGPLQHGLGYPAFIECASLLQQRNTDAMFTLLGGGSASAEARESVEERGLMQRVVVVDSIYDYSRVWQQFDVFVVDSRQQASALLILHAMAAGRPVVATEGGAIFDLIEDGVDGIIIPRDDPAFMAERVQMLVQNPQERLRMGQAAFAKVENRYKPRVMASALNRIYSLMQLDEPLPRRFETGSIRKK